MPISKAKLFNLEEQEMAIIGRAFSHPARFRIMTILNDNGSIRNSDLTKSLKMSKTTIHNHVKKLEDAKLIQVDFNVNCFRISKSPFADRIIEGYFIKMGGGSLR